MKPQLFKYFIIGCLFMAPPSFAGDGLLARIASCASLLRNSTESYDDFKTDPLKWKKRILESKRNIRGHLLRPDLASLLNEIEVAILELKIEATATWHPVLDEAHLAIRKARDESLPEDLILDIIFRYAVAHAFRNDTSLENYHQQLTELRKYQADTYKNLAYRKVTHVILPTFNPPATADRSKTDLAGILIYPLPKVSSVSKGQESLKELKDRLYFASVRTSNFPVLEEDSKAGLRIINQIRGMPASPLRTQLSMIASELSWLNQKAFLKGHATGILSDKSSRGLEMEPTFFTEAQSMYERVSSSRFGDQNWKNLFLNNQITDWEYAYSFFAAMVDKKVLPKRKVRSIPRENPIPLGAESENTLLEKKIFIAQTSRVSISTPNPLTTRNGLESLLKKLVLRYYGSHSLEKLLDKENHLDQFKEFDPNLRFLLSRDQVRNQNLPKLLPVESRHLDYHTKQATDPRSQQSYFKFKTEQDLDIPNVLIEAKLSYQFKGHGDSAKVRSAYFGKRLEYISMLAVSSPAVSEAYEKIRFNSEGNPVAKTIVIVTPEQTYRLRIPPKLGLSSTGELESQISNFLKANVKVTRTQESYFRIRYTTRLAKNDSSNEILGKITIDQVLSLSNPLNLPKAEMLSALLWGDPAQTLEYAFEHYQIDNHVRAISSYLTINYAREAEGQITDFANDLQKFFQLLSSP